jgi:hypothetical protein
VRHRQVLNAPGRPHPEPDVTVTGSRADLCAMLLSDDTQQVLAQTAPRVDGDAAGLIALLSLRTKFSLWFPIVTRTT